MFGSKWNFGLKTGKKIGSKIFLIKKNLVSKNVWVSKSFFGLIQILGPNNFTYDGKKKNHGQKENLGQKNNVS